MSMYRFKISDRVQSMKAQDLFFALGYGWANGAQEYKYLDSTYLYITEDTKDSIYYSKTLTENRNNEIECKLLQRKQSKFLIKLLSNPKKSVTPKYKTVIESILKVGYYHVIDSIWLNDFIIKPKYRCRTYPIE